MTDPTPDTKKKVGALTLCAAICEERGYIELAQQIRHVADTLLEKG
jgi:hypothetical protein